jgi:hypothetical protein
MAARNVTVGTVFPTPDIRAGLYVDPLLGKHFALLGSTGTGKSTAAALILHRICDMAPEGHIVMIDPHGEYMAAFRESGQLFDVSNLQMPYWLMNFEEHCEVFLTSTGGPPDRRRYPGQVPADGAAEEPAGRTGGADHAGFADSYLLSDLCNILQNEMGKLDKGHSSIPYMRVKSKIEEIRNDPRYQFMFSGMLVSDTMAEFVGRLFRLPAHGKPISIIDVSGVPSEITSTVVAVLSRLVFDYAIWSRQETTRPILLVCEEAHRYVPNERNSDGSSVGRILSRIAKEGRKYGVSLGLITQRPSDLAEGVLSQCGTIIAMRLNNDRDQQFVRAAMPEGARGFLDAIPALRNRECIICGEGVAIPIRVAFDDLDASRRPASADPSFSQLWGKSGGEEESVARTVTAGARKAGFEVRFQVERPIPMEARAVPFRPRRPDRRRNRRHRTRRGGGCRTGRPRPAARRGHAVGRAVPVDPRRARPEAVVILRVPPISAAQRPKRVALASARASSNSSTLITCRIGPNSSTSGRCAMPVTSIIAGARNGRSPRGRVRWRIGRPPLDSR